MEYKILYLEEAETDIDESYIWYETQRIGLGNEFIQHLEIAFDFIKKYPEASENKKKNIFRFIMNKFPFGIYYKVEKEQNQIQVIAILHFKRKSNIWRRRLSS